jgi:tetratricopeptide (TPR) repeat protein
VATGLPVLVLQNLGFAWLPRWHYAVVVGYDAEQKAVILRSGRTERHRERLDRFLRSWSLADGWAIVVVQPGQMPRSVSPDTYLRAILNSGRAWPPPTTLRALAAGVERWPDDADLNFALADEMRVQDAEASVRLYQRALEVNGEHLGVLNNYADLLAEIGCADEGLRLIERGINLAAADSPLLSVLESTRTEIESRLADSDAAECSTRFQD